MTDVFFIPNVADVVAYPLRARVYDLDWTILGLARWNGVVSGCDVTASTPAALSVEVASGRIKANGVGYNVTGDTVLLATADVTDPRWDLVVAKTDGTLDVYTGTPAESPVPPLPASIALGTEVALAAVLVPAGDTAVVQGQISPKQLRVEEPLTATDWQSVKASDAATGGSRSSTSTLANDSQLLFAMAANTTYTIRAMVEILTGATAGAKLGFTGPASPTRVALGLRWTTVAVGTTQAGSSIAIREHDAYDTTGVAATSAANRILRVIIEGTVENGSNTGNFAITWAQSTTVAETTKRLNGSILEWQ